MKTIKIQVFFNDILIGNIKRISLLEKPVDLDGEKLYVSHMLLDRMRIGEIFSRSFIHVKSQKHPLQIVIKEDDVETGRVQNAWLTAIKNTYMTDTWVVMEEMEIEAEKVSGMV